MYYTEEFIEKFFETVLGDVRRLSYVDRYTSIPVSFKENVAEHSYWVSFYSALLYNEIMREEGNKGLVSLENILLYAIVHDLPECITGDVVRTFKYSSPELKEQIDLAEDRIIEKFPKEVQNLLKVKGNLNLIEKEIVKLADFISIYVYFNREKHRGNRELSPFINRFSSDMDSQFNRITRYDDKQFNKLIGNLIASYYEHMAKAIQHEHIFSFTTK